MRIKGYCYGSTPFNAGNRDIVYEVLSPLYGNPSSPRALHKTIDAFFKSEGFDTIGFEESVWSRNKKQDLVFSNKILFFSGHAQRERDTLS